MTWEELEGWWTDAGTFESLLNASKLVAETGANKLNGQDFTMDKTENPVGLANSV
ncbi:hypothetical protein D3C83_241210 [compost metagenome]